MISSLPATFTLLGESFRRAPRSARALAAQVCAQKIADRHGFIQLDINGKTYAHEKPAPGPASWRAIGRVNAQQACAGARAMRAFGGFQRGGQSLGRIDQAC